MVVVPKADQLNPANNVALLFFQLTFGAISGDPNQPQRILSAFMAISSFGNIVVMTFTAARGLLPAYLNDVVYKCRLIFYISEAGNCQRGHFTFC
jgi:hypothetical protein